MTIRRCSRSACSERARATLTYVYGDSTAVLGPLALRHEPGSYDLCEHHCRALSVPVGWEIIRLPLDQAEPVRPSGDDLMALADAVREAAGFEPTPVQGVDHGLAAGVVTLASRRHLTVLADAETRKRPGR